MLLDTTVLIDLIQHDVATIKHMRMLEERQTACQVTTATVHELFVGVAYCRDPQIEKIRIEQSLIGKIIIPLDATTAELSGLLDGKLRNKGKNIGVVDCINAATAAAHDMPLLTRNVKQFEGIPGLQIETY